MIATRARSTAVALVALAIGAVGCTSSSSNAIAVTSTDTTCVPARTRLDAGKLTFEVTNKGKQTTELYVFGEGDKVIDEVENVGPGTSRTLTVDLAAGDYQLGCKPGQIRARRSTSSGRCPAVTTASFPPQLIPARASGPSASTSTATGSSPST